MDYFINNVDLTTLAAWVYAPEITQNENTYSECDYYSSDVSLTMEDESNSTEINPVEEYSDEHLFQRLHTMGLIDADGSSFDSMDDQEHAVAPSPVPKPNTAPITSIAEKVKIKSENNKTLNSKKRKLECLDGDTKETRSEKRRRKNSEYAPVVLVHRCTDGTLEMVQPNEQKPGILPDPVLQERLDKFLTTRGLPQWYIAKALNKNTTMVSNWMNNRPRVHGWDHFECPLRAYLDSVNKIV
uniref:Mitochondrial/bacterial CCA-adding enzyme n=1 Tax=Clandestinovirus TaxID=2831644 RepID=A0A8F8KUH0_9VIRU|nr:mitochondrial/bacterial CCA-adding enzyme [Clandestinovirus]